MDARLVTSTTAGSFLSAGGTTRSIAWCRHRTVVRHIMEMKRMVGSIPAERVDS